jgi:hypothetical protein
MTERRMLGELCSWVPGPRAVHWAPDHLLHFLFIRVTKPAHCSRGLGTARLFSPPWHSWQASGLMTPMIPLWVTLKCGHLKEASKKKLMKFLQPGGGGNLEAHTPAWTWTHSRVACVCFVRVLCFYR